VKPTSVFGRLYGQIDAYGVLGLKKCLAHLTFLAFLQEILLSDMFSEWKSFSWWTCLTDLPLWCFDLWPCWFCVHFELSLSCWELLLLVLLLMNANTLSNLSSSKQLRSEVERHDKLVDLSLITRGHKLTIANTQNKEKMKFKRIT